MDSRIATSVFALLCQSASLLVYQSVLQNETGAAFIGLLQAILQAERNLAAETLDCFYQYGRWFKALAESNQSWQDYLLSQILQDDNPFTRSAQRLELSDLPPALVTAARHDLQILQQLYHCDPQQLSQWFKSIARLTNDPISWHQEPTNRDEASAIRFKLSAATNWADELERFVEYYRQHGTGLFGSYQALRWQNGQLVGIAQPDPVKLSDLAGYGAQRLALVTNTEFLLQGYSALNVLLYGSRGAGKSSLIKAMLNEYGKRGLRLVEVAKSDLLNLPMIVDQLRDCPQKFIVFVDDLSFEADEATFKALKVALEGSLTARPVNVVVYATSNRRHLVREFFTDRPRPQESDEIHAWDTLQEQLSFSDRFGLTLTFEPADQSTYLQIVQHLARQSNLPIPEADLTHRALQWATRHNGRSGRTARQFVDFLTAELAIGQA